MEGAQQSDENVRFPVGVIAYGVQQAGKSNAAPAALEANIRHICAGSSSAAPAVDAVQVNGRIQELEASIQRERDGKVKIEESMKRVEAEIAEKRKALHDSNDVPDASEKGGFYVTAIIWVMLLVYLFVFYVNAAYNAFFYQAGGVGAGITAIMNPDALKAAFHTDKGYILCTYPFIFLGLGFLLHSFQKKKQYMLIASVYIGTFLYDALLAYEIVRKIHEARFLNQEVQTAWQFHMAFSEMEFYLILASGFLVYLVWGFLTAALIDGANKLFPKSNRKWLAESLEENRTALEALRQKSSAADSRIEQWEREKTEEQGKLMLVNQAEQEFHAVCNKMVHGFLKGWINYICLVHAHEPEKAEEASSQARTIAERVMKEIREGAGRNSSEWSGVAGR